LNYCFVETATNLRVPCGLKKIPVLLGPGF